jgi:hypothetical protein
MCPDPIPNPDTILLCSPFDDGDYVLSLHLYDIRENMYFKQIDLISMDYENKQHPPLSLTLYYMFVLNTYAEFKSRAASEQRLLGRILQVMHDNSIINLSASKSNKENGEPLRVELNNLSFERKIKLWTSTDTPNRLALFYTISPVFIESSKANTVDNAIDRNFLFRKNNL